MSGAEVVKLAAVRSAIATYRGAPPVTRAFVAARFVVAPVGPLEAELAGRSGRVLSLGSGLCMLERYLAVQNPNLEFVGIDLDEDKVALIAETRHRSPRVTLRLGDATAIDEPAMYDTVLICDALHHFPAEMHARVAQSVAAALVPDGRVIVKDLDVAPRWKYHWNRVHDRLVAGPEPIYCRPIDEMAEVFESAGLVVEAKRRLDHAAAPYAHYLITLRRPTDPEGTDGVAETVDDTA
ncbi:class I SAM-dependent methyltransferase [Candidatus Microthrix parvicella]|uniref:class I SAM-dependent methyltransferase n=1 Tax=Candidatus Neomicrothrix parvicella TaxID=41950 RepID=UPI0012FE7812|nr:class I SAM-dependent methyltransferase [Candidatus Microthrix parvicella]